MNSPAVYLHFGFILISLVNLLVIVLLILVFVLAVPQPSAVLSRRPPLDLARVLS